MIDIKLINEKGGRKIKFGRRKTIIILTISIIVFLLSGTIGLTLYINNDSDSGKLEPTVSISESELVVFEEFYCNVSNIPKDRNVSWVFNDGNISYGHNASHFYERSDVYIITCFVEDGEHLHATPLMVLVYNSDYYNEYSGIGFVDFRRGWEYRSEGADLFPGITQPIVNVRVTASNVVGTLDIGVWFIDMLNQPGGFIFSERYNLVNQDMDFQMEFTTDDLLPEVVNWSYIGVDLELRNGMVGNWQIELWVTYEKGNET